MKAHNVLIYHCLHCGNVVRNETALRPPCCCGMEMVKAAEQTIFECEEADSNEPAGVHCEMALSGKEPR